MQKTRSFIVIETLIMFLLVTTIPLWLHFFSSEDPSGKISVDIDRKVIEEPKESEEPKKEEVPIELPISEEEPASIIIIEEPINDLPIEDEEEPYEIEIEEPSSPIEEEDDINAREEEEEPSIPPEEDKTKEEQDVEAPEDFRIIIGGGGSGGDSFNIVANAGKDFSVYENDIVTLNGFLSPGAVSYLWTCKMDEKPVLIPNANSRIASFRAPLLTEDKEINCTLKVSDLFDPSISKEDGVKITIINGPIVNAGQDKVVNEAETVNLVSSCKGAGLLYNWQCDHKDIILQNRNTSIASFSTPFVDKDESLTCRLTVRDLGGEIKVDELNISIRNGPVAISQGDIVVTEGGTINLSASNSIGAIASYAWSCDNNFPAINTNLENYSLSAPSVTENTFHNCALTITDVLEETSTTTFTITVLKELAKKPRVYFNPYTRYITEGTEVTLSPIVESTAPVFDYSWSCTFNGNPLTLSNTSSKNPTFIASFVNDDYQKVLCTITATNEGGPSSATQTLKIINGPVASAGSKQTTQENRLVTLNGSHRGNIKEVNWTCDNDIILTNANTLSPSLTTPFVDSDTLITCTLTITDFEDKVDSNTTSITILNGPKAISSNITVRENKIGTFVNSSIGDLVSYNFTCPDSEGIFSIDNPQKRNPIITAYEVNENTSRTCTLTVTDSEGLVDSTTFITTITNYVENPNPAPTYPISPTTPIKIEGKNPGQQDKGGDFAIEIGKDGTVTLIWIKGEGTTHTYIKRMQAVAPVTREEGDLTYFNTGEVAKDEGLKLGETQCYSAWGYNIDSDTYSTDYASACIFVDLNIVEVEGYLLNTTKYVRANINTIGLLADLDLRYKKASNTEWTYLPKKKDVSSGLYTFEINNLEPGGVEYDFEVILAADENERTYTSSFVSEIVIPTISNALITSNNAESVDMSFDLNNGGALTNVTIEYADNIEFNNSIIITKKDQLSGKIKETFTNLIQEATYYYRITGENEKGISNVFEGNFKTESIVKNIEAKNILTSTSEIHFFLNTNHTENTLTIEYADNIEFIDSNIITLENQTYGEGIQTLDNLISNRSYYYKIIAEGKEYPNETNVNSFETLEIEIKASDIIIPREASKTLSFTVLPDQDIYTYLLNCEEGLILINENTDNPQVTSPYVTENTDYTCTLVVSDSINSKQTNFVITVNAGLVSYWPFNEGLGSTAYDSWSQNHGILVNGPAWITDENECISGACLSFDGSNDYVNVGNNKMQYQDNFTVTAWFKFYNIPNNATSSCGSRHPIVVNNDYGYNLIVRGDGKLNWYVYNAINAQKTVCSKDTVIGKYFFGAGVKTGQTITLYLNGVFQESAQLTSNAVYYNPSFPFSIGGYAMCGGNYFYSSGLIDEVKIYSEALSEFQIKQEYFTYRAIDNINFKNIKSKSTDIEFNLSRGASTLTNISIEYATDSLFNNSQTINLQNQEEGLVIQSLTNLIPETEYFVRIKASNDYGESKTFTSTFTSSPLATNITVSNILTSTADIVFDLNTSSANITLEYADNIEFTNPNIITLENQTQGKTTIPLSNLIENTTYYYNINIVDLDNYTYSYQNTFTTQTINLSVSNVTATVDTETTLLSTLTPEQSYTYLWNCDGLELTNPDTANPTFISNVVDTNYNCFVSASDGTNSTVKDFLIHITSNTLEVIDCTGCVLFEPDTDDNHLYTYYKWTNIGEGNITFLGEGQIDVLVVGGGGGGGRGGEGNIWGGGGGAGGLLFKEGYLIKDEPISVFIGKGGARASSRSYRGGSGENSVFGSLVAFGGGGGGSGWYNQTTLWNGLDGGSGGGGQCYKGTIGGKGFEGQGYDGSGSSTTGGGGGGGGAGSTALWISGGDGVNVFGEVYAKGGSSKEPQHWGSGGAWANISNSGNGGDGGTKDGWGSSGASGIVIIRIPKSSSGIAQTTNSNYLASVNTSGLDIQLASLGIINNISLIILILIIGFIGFIKL